MRIASPILLLCLFFSCTTETKKTFSVPVQLIEHIQRQYETKEISSTIGTTFKNGKKETYFEISVGKSKIIDNSGFELELFASDIALRLYSGMGKAEQKKYNLFIVKIAKNNTVIKFQYTNKNMQEATDNLLWLQGTFLSLVDEKEYIAARWRFDLQLVDTSNVNLEALYEPLEKKLGKFKNRELLGFTTGEIKLNGKVYPIMKISYTSLHGKKYILSRYMLLINDSEQRLLGIDFKS